MLIWLRYFKISVQPITPLATFVSPHRLEFPLANLYYM
jgi:hypothetical protein